MDGYQGCHEVARVVKLLQELGVEFRGPFTTSKGELMLVEDKILTVSELLEFFLKGQLNRDGIRNFLATQPE